MSRIFPGRNYRIMATETVGADIGMIKGCACPGKGSMTIIANFSTLNMPGVFPWRSESIVTTLAIFTNGKVINLYYVGP